MKSKINIYIVLITLIISASFHAHATLMEQILGNTKYIDLKLSPDGNHMAMTYKDGTKINMSIFDLTTSPIKVISGVALGGDLSVWNFYWANNSRIVYSVLISQSWYNGYKTTGEMFGINIDGSDHDVLFGQRVANRNKTGVVATASRIKKAESVLATFEMIDLLPDNDDFVLIKSTPFDSKDSVPTVYKLNIYNGKKRKVVKLPLPSAEAIADVNGHLKYAYGIDKLGKNKLFKLNKKKWSVVLEHSDKEGGKTPLSVFDDSMYILDNSDHELMGLYKVNLNSNEKELVYRNELTDIYSVRLNPNTKHPYLIETYPNKQHYKYFKGPDNLEKTHRQLIQAFKGNMVDFISFSKDLSKLIFKVSSDRILGDFYLFDRVKQNASFLVSQKPGLKVSQLAAMEAIAFTNREGNEIHGFFTKAINVAEGEIAPLVVMPHGGPHGARDYWTFDSQVQAFATNGISVLQVNYTGSDGYGKKFKSDGHKQWGGLIQNDITDGTKWAIESNRAQANKICIYGFSFGGYSALMSVEKEPDLYQCAAAGGGVFDLEMMYKAKDINTVLWGKEYLKKIIGKDEHLLSEFSPVNHTDKIKVPVFIAHGKKDTRVPISQANKLIKNLKKSGVKYETAFYSKEGHGFASLKNDVDFNTKLIKFLKKHMSN